jgi:uncharacterized protein YjbI with pentapeptide repeats
LLVRWLTEDGKQRAKKIQRILASGEHLDRLPHLLSSLPYVDEVTPQLDLRGLRLAEQTIDFQAVDLSHAHLEFVHHIGGLWDCQMVGTCFDGCYAINAIFEKDFTSASFVGATLNGSRFTESKLTQANFTDARLITARLNEADCQAALFKSADMRFAYCARADFRAADLRDANLTEAVLGRIQFDEQTLLQGANLTGARMSEDFKAFALRSGAIVRESQGEYALVELDTTVTILRRRNTDHHLDEVLAQLTRMREKLMNTHNYAWIDALSEVVSSELLQEVIEAEERAIKTMGYYV